MNAGGVQFPQLQFSLGTRPSAKNLATHFDPGIQPPVIVRKLGNVETIGVSGTPRSAFRAVNPERLALAVELARRNVQLARRSYSRITTPCTKEESKAPEEMLKAPLKQTTKSQTITVNKSKKLLQKKKGDGCFSGVNPTSGQTKVRYCMNMAEQDLSTGGDGKQPRKMERRAS